MSRRDRARRRRHQLREVEEQLGPDPSEIIHTFPDGWTIRRPGSIVGLIREGMLLDNCLRYCDDALHPDGIDPDEIGRLAGHMYSLRDPNNVAHACFVHAAARLHWPGCTTDVLGFQNSPVKSEYLERIEAWHDTLPYPTELTLRSDEIPDDDLERTAA